MGLEKMYRKMDGRNSVLNNGVTYSNLIYDC